MASRHEGLIDLERLHRFTFRVCVPWGCLAPSRLACRFPPSAWGIFGLPVAPSQIQLPSLRRLRHALLQLLCHGTPAPRRNTPFAIGPGGNQAHFPDDEQDRSRSVEDVHARPGARPVDGDGGQLSAVGNQYGKAGGPHAPGGCSGLGARIAKAEDSRLCVRGQRQERTRQVAGYPGP